MASSLVYSEGGGHNRVDRVSVEIPAGEHVALVGQGHSGKDDFAQLVARVSLPSGGRLVVGGHNFAEVHQAIPGRRIAYVAQNAHIFTGTITHNLDDGLKHRPVAPAEYDEAGQRLAERRRRDALAAGNSADDVRARWIDFEAAGVADAAALTERAIETLRRVSMDREVMGYGLVSRIDPVRHPALAEQALGARSRIRDRVVADRLSSYVELFDRDAYLSSMTLAENLLFGTPRDPAFEPARLADNAEVVGLLRDVGLLDDLVEAGAKVASLMVEIFADVSPDSELFDQFSFISAEDLPEFQALLLKFGAQRRLPLAARDRARLLGLTFRLVNAQHRLGVVDEPMQRKVVAARAEFARRFRDRGVVEFFEADRYGVALSLQENILFGRVLAEQANAQARVAALVREVARDAGMEDGLVRAGLDFEVGNAGSRLSYSDASASRSRAAS